MSCHVAWATPSTGRRETTGTPGKIPRDEKFSESLTQHFRKPFLSFAWRASGNAPSPLEFAEQSHEFRPWACHPGIRANSLGQEPIQHASSMHKFVLCPLQWSHFLVFLNMSFGVAQGILRISMHSLGGGCLALLFLRCPPKSADPLP